MTTEPSDTQPPAPPAAPKTSGLAIGGLIAGVLGLCTFGLGGIVGLVLSIVALRKIGRSAGQVGGRGLAVASLVVSISALLIGLVLAAAMLASFDGPGHGAMFAQSNLKQLRTAALCYAIDHDDQFPPAETWPQLLVDERYLGNDQALGQPYDVTSGRVVAMNAKLAGVHFKELRERERTVLFFECAPGSPPAGGPELLPAKPRFDDGHNIGFVDGHVESVPPQHVGDLIWDPKAPPAEP